MHFGEAIEEERLVRLLRPGDGIDTVLSADVYGAGEADRLLGRALEGVERDTYCLVGAIGHDFYVGERQGPRGFPRFTDPGLRPQSEYGAYLRMATERSLERMGASHFDLLLLHNPDSTGFRSPAVWEGLEAVRAAGLTRSLGVAPGPANGFTLDLIDCFERFGGLIDWAMIILGPMEPWPGELTLAAARRSGVGLITRVVDYGGLFHDDIRPGHRFDHHDHRAFRPDGWVEEGLRRLALMRPYATRHDLTPLQLACAWNLAQEPVRCVVPTLIQEGGEGARAIEDKRAELGALTGRLAVGEPLLTPGEVAELREIGDNSGCMALKGASTEYDGPPLADRWPLDPERRSLAARWGIDPDSQLVHLDAPTPA